MCFHSQSATGSTPPSQGAKPPRCRGERDRSRFCGTSWGKASASAVLSGKTWTAKLMPAGMQVLYQTLTKEPCGVSTVTYSSTPSTTHIAWNLLPGPHDSPVRCPRRGGAVYPRQINHGCTSRVMGSPLLGHWKSGRGLRDMAVEQKKRRRHKRNPAAEPKHLGSSPLKIDPTPHTALPPPRSESLLLAI